MKELVAGHIRLNSETNLVTGPRGTVTLARHEAALLLTLVPRLGQLVRYGELIRAMYGDKCPAATADVVIRATIMRARRKLDQIGISDPFTVVRGHGLILHLSGEALRSPADPRIAEEREVVSTSLAYGDVTLDVDRRILTGPLGQGSLARRPSMLLSLLMAEQGKPVSRASAIAALFPGGVHIEEPEAVVRVLVWRLRAQLGQVSMTVSIGTGDHAYMIGDAARCIRARGGLRRASHPHEVAA